MNTGVVIASYLDIGGTESQVVRVNSRIQPVKGKTGSTGHRGLVVYGGEGGDSSSSPLPGGAGIIVYGGTGGKGPTYTYGGPGIIAYGGQGYFGNNKGDAIQAHGDIVIYDGKIKGNNNILDVYGQLQIGSTSSGLTLNENSIKFDCGAFSEMDPDNYYYPNRSGKKTQDISWSVLSNRSNYSKYYITDNGKNWQCIKAGKNLLVLRVLGRDGNGSGDDEIVINITDVPYYALHIIGIKIINKDKSSDNTYKSYDSKISVCINGGELYSVSSMSANTDKLILKPFFATDGGGTFLY